MFKTIKVEELEIVGTSVSGHWTCIVVTNYGVAFDMGCLFGESLACDVVCVTHGHSDHVASLAHHLRVRTMRNDKKARYIMPRQCIRQFYALFASLYSLDNHIEDGISLEQAQILLAKQATVSEATIDALSTPSSPPSTTITSSSSSSSLVSTNSTASQSFTARATSPPPMITSVEIRDNLTPPPPTYIEIGKSRFLRCFATNHRVPSVAYCIYERRSQLKVKYRSMPNDVIAAAAKRGEAVSDVTYVAKIAFTGDTIIDGVLMHSELLSCNILIMECTIWLEDDMDVAATRQRGHIHLSELNTHAEQFRNKHVILTHISPRYSTTECQKLLQESAFGKSIVARGGSVQVL